MTENCYRALYEDEIRVAIIKNSIPEEAFARDCCWITIREVRNLHPTEFDGGPWLQVVDRRLKLLG